MNRQTDEKSLYEQQEDRILAQSDAFISLLTKRGILGDHEIDNEKIRTAQQKKRQTSYHNTKMLLQHYRTIAWVLECFPADIAAELDTPFDHIDQLIDKVDMEMAMGNRKLEGRMEGVRKSRLLFDRLNEALTVLKSKPGNGKLLYDVVYLTYIAAEHPTLQDMIDQLEISKRTYYRLRQQAITILSIRLWATPVIGIDFWFDMLTLLENLE